MKGPVLHRRSVLVGAGATFLLSTLGGCRPYGESAALMPPRVQIDPRRLCFDSRGRAFHVRPRGHHVARLDVGGREVWRYGEANNPRAALNFPVDLFGDTSGRAYIVDKGNERLVVLDEEGKLSHTIGENLPPEQRTNGLAAATIGAMGELYLVDGMGHRIVVLGPDGSMLRTIGAYDIEAPEGLNGPRAIAIAPNGDLHVIDRMDNLVQVFDRDGVWKQNYGPPGVNGLSSICITREGVVCLANEVSARIFFFDPAGQPLGEILLEQGGRRHQPSHLSIDATGTLHAQTHPVG